MVAYGFKERFIDPIKSGLGTYEPILGLQPKLVRPKRQTIRAVGKRRHARPGEILQLYYGMRTKQCRSIGVARCTEARDIVLTFGKLSAVSIGGTHMPDGSQQRQTCYMGGGLDTFAQMDGFSGWADMVRFWNDEHGSIEDFIGVLIEWEPIHD
jgi:hypothetical protein